MSAHDTRDDGAAGASQAEIERIKAAHADTIAIWIKADPPFVPSQRTPLYEATYDIAVLLAEVDRLRAEVAALRPVVAAMERYGAAMVAEDQAKALVAPEGEHVSQTAFDVLTAARRERWLAHIALTPVALARAAHDDAPDAGGR